ncbi:MAG: NosD domain-containing protein [Gemmatimonadota bacterium]|jgi:parallel beta-helix repeat protein|nr:hypothetical protein [Gemmatimonadota bacterium]MDP6461802.1 NosD domain-containing protein [Gemmatimonadota bacterium]MDP6528908.1 NosD domain-containing protein [Gemmatimonadota bacterium]MDP6802699.1 NosD domain-containing protein [Gemmatimonadota bacterium]MDP7032507.1 NosD domain-containing protein [Gemmatimonadota bacterium]
MRFKTPAALLLLFAMAAPADAARLRVEAAPYLQDVVDSAAYGDTVFVAPGLYPQLRLRTGIRLISEGGPEVTTLRNDRFWVIQAKQTDSLTVVDGFTLDGVEAAEGILHTEDSFLTVRNCVLQNGWSGIRSEYSDLRVENCVISGCQNGIYLFESRGTIIGNTISGCINGMSVTSSSPRILRNEVVRNSVGIFVTEHSNPSIGGSLSSANRIHHNRGGNIRNSSYLKEFSIRTKKPMTLSVPFNFWGTDCPDSLSFRGPVIWSPWVAENGKESLESCPPETGAIH